MATAANARAQATELSLQAPKTTRPAIASGEVATMAFTVQNNSKDTTVAEPKVIVPAGWRVVMSPAATVIAPGERDIWLVSVKAPSNAAAGSYSVRLDATRGGPGARQMASDSVAMSIAERHEVMVRPVSSLSYVMGGESYVGVFIIQNLGNVPARFDLTARSTQGNAPSLVNQVVALAPGQVDTIKASVMIPSTVTSTTEEVLLLSAVNVAMDTVRADASMQATVIPSAKNGPSLWTVPTEIALRTATAGSGVSAFTAAGYGKLAQNSDVMVDFMLRGPTGKSSMFGEQETYHVGFRTQRSSLSLGDDSYGFSRLLTSGGRGTGAEVRSSMSGYVGGAYIQRDRTRSGGPTEMSAMLGTDEKRAVSASIVALNRSSSTGSAQAVTVGSNALIGGANFGLEIAASDSQNVAAAAGRVRVTGDSKFFLYDLSAQRVSTGFASSQQGSTDLRAGLTGHSFGAMTLTANTTLHIGDPMATIGGFGQQLSTTTFAAGWANGLGIEAEHFDRKDIGGFDPINGMMETMRVRARTVVGRFDGSMNLHAGVTSQADSAVRAALGLGATVSARVDDGEYFSIFGDVANGGGLGESGSTTVSSGLNAQLRFSATTIRAMSFISQSMQSGKWSAQSDVTIEQSLRRSTIALRGRLAATGDAPAVHAFFLEIKTPMGLPTSAVNTIGRARAEIVDVETGRGVAGALVRLGGQAAVTDAQGIATFRDLKPGTHRALIDGAAVAGRVVASGSEVSISATSKKPTEFRMNLSRGAQIMVRVRSFERTSATIANGGDTLTEVGAVGQVMVALITATDTVWQTSDERGRVDFGSVAPGRYAVAIPRYDAPKHMAFATTAFEVEIGAGQQRQLDFKLIPEIRAVEFQGEAVLIAVPARAAKATPAPTTVTGKPAVTPITGKPDQPVTTMKPLSRQQQQQPQR